MVTFLGKNGYILDDNTMIKIPVFFDQKSGIFWSKLIIFVCVFGKILFGKILTLKN